MAKHGKLNKAKAQQILDDGEINGKPLTDKQKALFRMIAGGGPPSEAEEGALIAPSFPAYSHVAAGLDEAYEPKSPA